MGIRNDRNVDAGSLAQGLGIGPGRIDHHRGCIVPAIRHHPGDPAAVGQDFLNLFLEPENSAPGQSLPVKRVDSQQGRSRTVLGRERPAFQAAGYNARHLRRHGIRADEFDFKTVFFLDRQNTFQGGFFYLPIDRKQIPPLQPFDIVPI